MNKEIFRIIHSLKSLPFRNIKRKGILLFFLSALVMVTIHTFSKIILILVIAAGALTYFTDLKISINTNSLNPANLRKVFYLLIFGTAFFALTDVDWRGVEWLKSYIDWGTLMFLLLLFISYLMHIKKNVYILVALVSLTLIPVFVIIPLPIHADAYAVFAFLLVTFLVIQEVREIRNIQ